MKRRLRTLAAGALIGLSLVVLAIGVRDENNLVCFWAIVGAFGFGMVLTTQLFKEK